MRRLRKTGFILLSLTILLIVNQAFSTPLPGVSLALAQERKALLSNIRYQLYFSIPGEKQQPVQASAQISFLLKEAGKELVLDFMQKEGAVRSILVNGKKEPVHHVNEHLVIRPQFLIQGINAIKIVFEAGSQALNRSNDYMYTLFVPERARTAFPCFDQPDLKAIFDLQLDIPAGWSALSNGEAKKTATKKTYTSWQFEPSDTISTYLFAFTAGKYTIEKRKRQGKEMQFFYRETDSVKLKFSMNALFDMHYVSLQFMEKYTGIAYPFKKFSFAAIPDFQFGGMEHPGAVWYNANSLFLDSSATRTQVIRRAGLVAHETSHMWFGDLVTMKWFDDVWTKEVFANFMADKIVSEILPDDNAELKFLTEHFPAAYGVDRTKGANPIRQPLDNLNEAGSLYGSIIYHKAPIMMQQLERRIGEEGLRKGLQLYLRKFAFGNSTWPDLINILDAGTPDDLSTWNDEWVNKAGRPVINENLTDIKGNTYGLFTIDTATLKQIPQISNTVLRAFSWLNLYENVIEGRYLRPGEWVKLVLTGLQQEKEELIGQMLLNELQSIYWVYLSPKERVALSGELESVLQTLMGQATQPGLKKLFFKTWVSISLSEEARTSLYEIWKKKDPPAGVKLSDDEFTGIAAELSLKQHPDAAAICMEEAGRIKNLDKKSRWEFLLPALFGNEKVRDDFFSSLKEVKNRRKESWVNTAVAYLHHPLREQQSVKYILPSLEWLPEIQQTGDIFFPANWLEATLEKHQSAAAEKVVVDFITSHPHFNQRLLNKLLQAADPLFRARRILGSDE